MTKTILRAKIVKAKAGYRRSKLLLSTTLPKAELDKRSMELQKLYRYYMMLSDYALNTARIDLTSARKSIISNYKFREGFYANEQLDSLYIVNLIIQKQNENRNNILSKL